MSSSWEVMLKPVALLFHLMYLSCGRFSCVFVIVLCWCSCLAPL
jgi:hypothetical protein